MGKKIEKNETSDEKRRRNRRFNTVLYIISAALVLAGVIIIVNDTTYFFDRLFKKEAISSGNVTFPPIDLIIDVDDYTPVPTAHFTLDPNTTPTPEPTPTEAPVPQPPVCVYFPQYDIACPIDPVGYNSLGQMATVRAHDRAGWLETSGTPTTGGNILIAGHNRYSGKLGYFSVIKDDLQIGDQVIIEMANGEMAFYLVEAIEKWRYDEVPAEIMQTWGEPRLTLITCYGDYSSALGSSIHRVIAICKPVQIVLQEDYVFLDATPVPHI